ncbi:MAG: arginyltransferase [Rhizobiales bacterium]|nr:arginyltransferase [Hyphomicrobiales bacterium]
MNKTIIQNIDNLTFYLTVEDPCSYLDGKVERKIFTKLNGKNATDYFEQLSQHGFRRSQNIAYIPACKACNACRSARIIINGFKFSKSQRRVLNKNKDLIRKIKPNHPSSQQYRLFNRYINARHSDGEMSNMGVMDFAKMIAESNVNTKLFEYYLPNEETEEDTLVAVALTDIMSDGVSMVYSFFEPSLEKTSIGKYLILDHIRYSQENKLPYVYLGFYIDGSKSMEYKNQYQPQEQFDGTEWQKAD